MDVSALSDKTGQSGEIRPIPITPDGTLLCDTARLRACQTQGLTKVLVVVRVDLAADDLAAVYELIKDIIAVRRTPPTFLPDWPLLRRIVQRPAPTTSLLRQSILTLSAAADISPLFADVIIVASGGEGLTELPGYPPRCVFGQRRQMLVIDLVDDHDALW